MPREEIHERKKYKDQVLRRSYRFHLSVHILGFGDPPQILFYSLQGNQTKKKKKINIFKSFGINPQSLNIFTKKEKRQITPENEDFPRFHLLCPKEIQEFEELLYRLSFLNKKKRRN